METNTFWDLILWRFSHLRLLTFSQECPGDEVWKEWESLIFSRSERCFNFYQDYSTGTWLFYRWNCFSIDLYNESFPTPIKNCKASKAVYTPWNVIGTISRRFLGNHWIVCSIFLTQKYYQKALIANGFTHTSVAITVTLWVVAMAVTSWLLPSRPNS